MCPAAMATATPPLTFLLLLLQMADGSFPEEPSPLSYVPVEGMCVLPAYNVCAGDEWLPARSGNQRSKVKAPVCGYGLTAGILK